MRLFSLSHSLSLFCAPADSRCARPAQINRKYDPPKAPKVVFDSDENKGMLEHDSSGSSSPMLGGNHSRQHDDKRTLYSRKQSTSSLPLPRRTGLAARADAERAAVVMQYLVPVAVPVVLALTLAPFMAATVATSTRLAPTASTGAAALAGEPAKLGAVVDDSAFRAVTAGLPPVVGATTPDAADEALLNSAEATEAAELAVAIDGGSWDAQLLDAISPACKSELITKPYDTSLRTGFVSYPRSGNSCVLSRFDSHGSSDRPWF